LLYGSGYRPKENEYATIIKIFTAGQLLENGNAYPTWQEIANNVRLPLATVRYIYAKAHKIVYGRPGKKRRYKTDELVTIPDSAENIPEDPGPSLREKLTKKGIIEIDRHGLHKRNDGVTVQAFDSFFGDIDSGIRENCSICSKTFANSEGKYSPDPVRPHNEIFTCSNCSGSSR
jgi:hypothetical protein